MFQLHIRPFVAVTLILLAATAGAQRSTAVSKSVSDVRLDSPSFDWQQLGPLRGAGPSVRHVMGSTLDPHHVYASSTAGLLRSTDGGASWSVHARWPDGIGQAVPFSVSPVDPQRIAIARGMFGMKLSSDGGATWYEPATLPPVSTFWCVAHDPVVAEVLFYGTSDGVWRSTDGGVSFEHVLDTTGQPGTTTRYLRIDRNDRLRIYAVVSSTGVYVSHDGGDTWTLRPLPSAASYPFAVAIDPMDGRRLLIGHIDVHLTQDEGLSWTSMGLANGADSVGFDALDRDRLYAGSRYEGLHVSSDGGLTWNLSTDPGLDRMGGHPQAIHSSAAHPGEVLVAGLGGFARSVDGGVTFARSNAGLDDNAYVSSIAVDAGDPTHLVARTGGSLFVSLDDGASWTESAVGPNLAGYDVIAAPMTPGRFYAAKLGGFMGNGGTLWRSDDGGFNFNAVYQDPSIYFWHLDAHPSAADVLFAAGRGLLRSDDAGVTWVNLGLPQSWVWDVAVSPANPATIYASTGLITYASHDGGATWTASTLSPPTIARDIEADPIDPNRAWASVPGAVVQGGLFRTDDGGQTWNRVSSSYPSSVVAHRPRSHPNLLVVGDTRYTGVLGSFNGGNTAFEMYPQLESVVTSFASTTTALFAGTAGHGIGVVR